MWYWLSECLIHLLIVNDIDIDIDNDIDYVNE